VKSGPDLILAATPELVRQFKAPTTTIPIVALVADPIAFGFIPSVARPGGNITGVSVDAGLANARCAGSCRAGGGARLPARMLILGQQLRRTSAAGTSRESACSLRTRARRLTERTMKEFVGDELGAPKIVDRSAFRGELDALRVREKAHTREGDAIAAARRRLPMVEVPGATPLIGECGAVTLLDAFEGRRMLIAYYFMWHTGHRAAEQCEGCTLLYIAGPRAILRSFPRRHLRHVLPRPIPKSARYRDFMGGKMPYLDGAAAPPRSVRFGPRGREVCGARHAGRRRFLSWPRAASIGPQLRVKR
jgi:hypothetical protein